MKKLLILILSFLYLGASTGATVHLHYCMGKLVHEKNTKENGRKCAKCGMKKDRTAKKSCCKDEHKLLKIEKDQQVNSKFSFSADPVAAILPPAFPEWRMAPVSSTLLIAHRSNAPPRTCSVPVYLMHCTFLI